MYNSTKNNWSNGHSTYSLALPKKIKIGDSEVVVKLKGTKGKDVVDKIIDKTDWQAVLVKDTDRGCGKNTKGVWEQKNAHRDEGSINIDMVGGRGLQSGQYTVNIPYILAWGASDDKNPTRNFLQTWERIGDGARSGEFTMEFSVENKCNIHGGNKSIILNHNSMTPDNVNGHKIVGDSLSISCSSPTPVRIMLSPQYVDLGNGVTSLLHLEAMGKEHVNMPLDVTIDKQRKYIKVISTLQGRREKIDAGDLSGSSILTILYN